MEIYILLSKIWIMFKFVPLFYSVAVIFKFLLSQCKTQKISVLRSFFSIWQFGFFQKVNSSEWIFNRYVGMGLSLLVVPFLPSSNMFFIVGFVLAERTLYLPSAGYCLMVAIGLQNLQAKFGKSKIPIVLFGTLIAVYFGRSWIRSDQWRHEKSLFQSALGVCPLNAKVHYNIAKNAADLGNSSLAEAEYREALR